MGDAILGLRVGGTFSFGMENLSMYKILEIITYDRNLHN